MELKGTEPRTGKTSVARVILDRPVFAYGITVKPLMHILLTERKLVSTQWYEYTSSPYEH